MAERGLLPHESNGDLDFAAQEARRIAEHARLFADELEHRRYSVPVQPAGPDTVERVKAALAPFGMYSEKVDAITEAVVAAVGPVGRPEVSDSAPSFTNGEVKEASASVGRSCEVTDEMVEVAARMMNDRILANPTHGAFWEHLTEEERRRWRVAVKPVLDAALGATERTDG